MFEVVLFNNGRDACLINSDSGLPVIEVMQYETFLKHSNRSPNTRISYMKALKKLYNFAESIGEDVLKAFDQGKDPFDFLGRFMNYLQGNKEAPNKNVTVNYALGVVYSYYDYLSARNLISKNARAIFPTVSHNRSLGFLGGLCSYTTNDLSSIAYLPADPTAPTSYINWNQYETLIGACSNARDRVLIGLQFENGLRVGEALGIHLADIHLEKRQIDIVYRDNNENHAYVKRKAERTIGLSRWMCEWLIELICEMESIDTEYLFCVMNGKTRGRPLHYANTADLCNRLSKKTGINVHNHMFRHGCAQERYKDGWDLAEIQSLLGHSSSHSTERYAGPDKEMIRQKSNNYLDGKITKW